MSSATRVGLSILAPLFAFFLAYCTPDQNNNDGTTDPDPVPKTIYVYNHMDATPIDEFQEMSGQSITVRAGDYSAHNVRSDFIAWYHTGLSKFGGYEEDGDIVIAIKADAPGYEVHLFEKADTDAYEKMRSQGAALMHGTRDVKAARRDYDASGPLDDLIPGAPGKLWWFDGNLTETGTPAGYNQAVDALHNPYKVGDIVQVVFNAGTPRHDETFGFGDFGGYGWDGWHANLSLGVNWDKIKQYPGNVKYQYAMTIALAEIHENATKTDDLFWFSDVTFTLDEKRVLRWVFLKEAGGLPEVVSTSTTANATIQSTTLGPRPLYNPSFSKLKNLDILHEWIKRKNRINPPVVDFNRFYSTGHLRNTIHWKTARTPPDRQSK